MKRARLKKFWVGKGIWSMTLLDEKKIVNWRHLHTVCRWYGCFKSLILVELKQNQRASKWKKDTRSNADFRTSDDDAKEIIPWPNKEEGKGFNKPRTFIPMRDEHGHKKSSSTFQRARFETTATANRRTTIDRLNVSRFKNLTHSLTHTHTESQSLSLTHTTRCCSAWQNNTRKRRKVEEMRVLSYTVSHGQKNNEAEVEMFIQVRKRGK